jgi:replication factor C subunit 3/5
VYTNNLCICDFCSINVTEDGKKALLTLAEGDMRKALNILQSTSMAYKEVTEINVYTCVGHPLKSDILNIVKWLLNEDFSSAYRSILYCINSTVGARHTYLHFVTN